MLFRDLEVIISYFKNLKISTPQNEEYINSILNNIEFIKEHSGFCIETSTLLPREFSNKCSICKKKVFIDD